MAYIGKTPVIGNFVKLDAITVVNGQAAYTMQNGGVNFTSYDNVNQFLVSLNGVLQAPTDSFTVSGSTLTFASNLSTGDVIDFVLVLGNSLDIGTPSDNTISTAKLQDSSVSLAKLTATGTKDATTFLRGDNTFQAISSGTYSVHKIDSYEYDAGVATTAAADYIDIAGGNYVSFTPTSTDDYILLTGYSLVWSSAAGTGSNVHYRMDTSTSISASSTRIAFIGRHEIYSDNATNFHQILTKSHLFSCSSLTPSTTYYIEMAGAHYSSNSTTFNYTGVAGFNASTDTVHKVNLIHYKKN